VARVAVQVPVVLLVPPPAQREALPWRRLPAAARR